MADVLENAPEETLDPEDWTTASTMAHKIIDDAIHHLSQVRERPIWQEMPPHVRTAYLSPVPDQPTALENVYAELSENLMPYPMGNIHPRFWGWYMGAGNFTGALGDFLAAIEGSNLGGGNTAAAQLDRQVVNWLKSMMGFPATASGTLTSGGSMANMVGLTVARNAMAGVDVRTEGVTNLPQPLRYYASDQVHSCHQKAMETLGLGSRALRLVPSDQNFRMDIPSLEAMIAEDRAAGMRPACVIATAGTTNTGSIDDLKAIGEVCRRQGIWFHIDGCIGALIKIAPLHAHMVDGIETADSLALDPHKWLHTPFEAGCAIVKDRNLHFSTFALHGDYLEEKPRGVAAGEYLFDYGFELSRGFKALKTTRGYRRSGRRSPRRRHGGRHEMRAALEALAALEVAVRGRGAALARLQLVGVHGKAHRAARLAPVEAGGLEDLVEAFGLGLLLHEAGARHDHGIDAGATFLPSTTFRGGAQILDAAIGAGADEDAVERDVGDLGAGGQAHIVERAL
jgi:aromatic-L-amino-acid decarboxylase